MHYTCDLICQGAPPPRASSSRSFLCSSEASRSAPPPTAAVNPACPPEGRRLRFMSTTLWNQERPWRAPGGPCGTTASTASHATAVVIIRRLIPATLQSTTGGPSSRVRFGRRVPEACSAPLRARRTASRSNSVALARVRPYAHRGRRQPCAAPPLAPVREEGREGFDWGSMPEASRRPTDLSAHSAW